MRYPYGRYTAQPKPETLLAGLTPWEFLAVPDPQDSEEADEENTRPTKFKKAQVARLRAEGLTPAQIAVRTGLHVRRVRKILHFHVARNPDA